MQDMFRVPDATHPRQRQLNEATLIADFLRRRATMILLVVIAAVAAGLGVQKIVRPQYTAVSQILLNPPRDRTIGTEGTITEAAIDPQAFESQISLIQSFAILERVVDKEKLADDPEFQSGSRLSRLLKWPVSRPHLGSADATGKDAPPAAEHPAPPEPQQAASPAPGEPIAAAATPAGRRLVATQQLQNRISVDRVGRTYVIGISVTTGEAAKSARIADAICAAYVEDKVASRADAIRRAAPFLEDARVINPATEPQSPSFPKTPLVLGLSIFLGLGLGTGAALVSEWRRSQRIRSKADFAEDFPIGVLGTIPKLPALGRWPRAAQQLRSAIEADKRQVSTRLRTILGELLLARVHSKIKIVEVTSTHDGEGRSTAALAMALSAARTGMRVLLVDADFRSATLTGAFGLADAPGLMELITGAAKLSQCCHQAEDGVEIIPTGLRNTDAAWLFASKEMRSALEEANQRFDLVILDSPSIDGGADPLLLAPGCDAVILVARWNSTRRKAVRLVVERLLSLQATPIFAVLNKAPRR